MDAEVLEVLREQNDLLRALVEELRAQRRASTRRRPRSPVRAKDVSEEQRVAARKRVAKAGGW